MIPILYEKNETAFTTNGLGRLRDCISCKVSEERNSIYECEFEYPVNGANFDKIQLGRIIGVEHDDTSNVQPFDIVSYSKPINGVVTFHAVHISYRQSKIVASGSNVAGLSETFAMLKSGLPENPFTYWTDKESTTQFPLGDGVPRSVREMLGGTEGSVLDTYGGEFEWDKFNVKLWEHRGSPTDFCIRYGVNMTEYEDETDSSESYSAIVPYWIGQDGDTQTVIKGGMISSGTTVSGRVDCVAIDYSQDFQDAQPTVEDLEQKAQQTLSSKNPQLATQTIKVGFIRLQDSGEYSGLGNLLKCKLCDTVQVIFPRYKMSGRFKIVKTEYDVLAERFTAMELGTLSTTLSEALGIGSGGGGTTYSTSGGGETYRLTKSGDVITLTGSGGTTSSVTDSDTTYGLSLSSGNVLALVAGGTTQSVTLPDDDTKYGLSISGHTVSLVENGTTSSVTVPDNFTSAYETKLTGIEAGAEVNVQSDWNVTNTSSDAYIKNKPTLAAVATSGNYSDLSGTPTLATVATSGDYDDLSGKPNLAAVATSGSYNDLSNKPSIPSVSVTQKTTSGTNIADITIDGTTTQLYAPTGGGGTGADYVTEQSTSGIWTYRKWNSGLAECWGTTANRTVTSWTQWGGIYYGNPYNVRDSYPGGLFISAPNCQAQIGTNDGGDMFLVKGSGSGTEGTSTYTPAFYPARGSSGSTGVTYTVSYYAVGKWK